jgi:anti-anti-sigma regulatory factor
MQVKVDTKEKFTSITPIEPHIYDNMAAELAATCNKVLEATPKNLILNLQAVTAIDDDAAQAIAQLQQQFYEANNSFVICEMKPTVEASFEKLELLEFLNATPTESEAWDIVQMEEIERELMDGDEITFSDEEEEKQ